jgi:hypothetical protein
MNWRRGLIRLWIVGSIAWIGAIAAVSAYQALSDPVRFIYNGQEITFPPDFTESDRPDIARKLAEERSKHSERTYDQSTDDEAAGMLKASYSAYWAAWPRRVLRFAAFALLPPVFVLLVGSALLWAVAGFRAL